MQQRIVLPEPSHDDMLSVASTGEDMSRFICFYSSQKIQFTLASRSVLMHSYSGEQGSLTQGGWICRLPDAIVSYL